MRNPPPIPVPNPDALESGSAYFGRTDCANMRDKLVQAVLSTFKNFREYAKTGIASPRYQFMFENIREWAPFDDELDLMISDIHNLSQEKFDIVLTELEKQLTNNLKLYLNRMYDYSLIIPTAYCEPIPGSSSINKNQMKFYGYAAWLFQNTILSEAERRHPESTRDDSFFKSPDGLTVKARRFVFNEEQEMLGFIDDLLPIGVKACAVEGVWHKIR